MKGKKEKGCKNCDYFIQYYIKTDYKYVPIERGTCMCASLTPEQRLDYDYFNGCENFKNKA